MRFLYILIVSLLATFVSDAQAGFGPEIGIGMSTMHFAPPLYPIAYTAASVSPIASGTIGGLADLPLNKHFYFQAGIELSRKGAVRSFSYYKNDSFNESVNQTIYINYFDVPVNVIFKTGMQGKGRFTFGLGATPAYIIGGRNKLKDHLVLRDTLTETSDNTSINIGRTLSGFDIGLNMIAGYELPVGK